MDAPRRWLQKIIDRLFPGGLIARRLMVAVIVFSSLITLLTTSFQLFRDYQREMDAIQQFFEKHIRVSHLGSISNSVWVVDEKQITIQLDGLTRLPHVEYLAIHIKGERRWHSGRIVSRHLINRTFPLTAFYRDAIHEIGQLEAVVGVDNIYWQLVEQGLTILISNGLKTFLVAGFILFLFQYLVTRHLTHLADHVRQLDWRRPYEPCALDRPQAGAGREDEIDQVVASVNEMSRNLEESFRTLAEAHERFRMLSETLHELFWIGTPTWDEIYFVSNAFEEIWGQSCQTMMEHPMAWFDAVVPEDRAQVQEDMARMATESFTEHLFNEFRIMRPDGTIRWILVRVYAVQQGDGKPHIVVGVAEDRASEINKPPESHYL